MKKKTKKRIQHVSKRLGLTPLPARPTMADYQARRKELEKKIASGKFRGHLLHRLHSYIWTVDLKMRRKKGIPAGAVGRGAKNAFNPNQLVLPGFLKTLNVVRIEELVAQKIADVAIAKGITANVTKAVRRAKRVS